MTAALYKRYAGVGRELNDADQPLSGAIMQVRAVGCWVVAGAGGCWGVADSKWAGRRAIITRPIDLLTITTITIRPCPPPLPQGVRDTSFHCVGLDPATGAEKILAIDDQTYKALTCESYVWRGQRFIFAINSGNKAVRLRVTLMVGAGCWMVIGMCA